MEGLLGVTLPYSGFEKTGMIEVFFGCLKFKDVFG